MAKILLLGVFLFVGVGGGVVLLYGSLDGSNGNRAAHATAAAGIEPAGPHGPAYRYGVIERGDIRSSVAATGDLAPVATVLVGSQVSGQIKEIYADFNDEVERDEPVALIDPVSFEIVVEQAQADLDVARAAVETQRSTIERLIAAIGTAQFDHESAVANTEAARIKAEEAAAEVRRKQALGASGIAAERERAESAHQAAIAQARSIEALERAKQSLVQSAEADVRAARSQLVNLEAMARQKEAALRHAQIELERTVIRAPVEGVVIQRTVEAGQTVAASLQAPTLFTIAQDLRDMQVNAAIDESEIGHIVPGQRVEFTVDAYPESRFTGTVAQIRKSPQTLQNVVTYTVVVQAPNPDLLLLPGMTASAAFIIAESKEVVKVPNAALRFTPSGAASPAGQSQVWVDKAGTLHAIPVDVGLTDLTYTEVMGDGLEEGGRVAIGIEAEKPSRSAGQRLLGIF